MHTYLNSTMNKITSALRDFCRVLLPMLLRATGTESETMTNPGNQSSGQNIKLQTSKYDLVQH